MRRTVLYTASLMFAAGASLALAGPASAAPDAAESRCCRGGGLSSIQAPRVPSLQNYQWLGQTSVTNQIVLNNIGNPQIGFGNYNGGGSASASSTTTQTGGIFGGGW